MILCVTEARYFKAEKQSYLKADVAAFLRKAADLTMTLSKDHSP